MSEEARRRILQMLEDNVIDASEASQLIHALGQGGALPDEDEKASIAQTTDYPAESVEIGSAEASDAPDMGSFRRAWQTPFMLAVALLVATGLWLGSAYARHAGQVTVGMVCAWTSFILAGFAVLLAFWARSARWLQVRVQEKEGRRINISLPVPIRLARWGIGVAQTYVDAETRGQLELAQSLIDVFDEEMGKPDARPLLVDVNDEDGDKVQVYIG